MKQVIQSLKTGATRLQEVPSPEPASTQLLLRTRVSLISAGTERMLINFGKANYLQKARQQPDKVRMVIDKIRTDGFLATVQSVQNKLDAPLEMGYSNVATVVGLGHAVTGFKIGQRVVSNGKHAEITRAYSNLAAVVPDEVSDEEAAFTVVAAIALQGVRLAQVSVGEVVVVSGLGLIGLLSVQLLQAQGCQVIGIDYDANKLAMAAAWGAKTVNLSHHEEAQVIVDRMTAGHGVDAVIIAAATQSNQPVQLAADLCRKRGRIVLVGVAGLQLSRAAFYEKELSFQVSCSYGSGRYDSKYEEQGQDYPYGLVRWTAQRNFQAVLALMASKRLNVLPLISHRFAIEEVSRAYELVSSNQPVVGIILQYSQQQPLDSVTAHKTLLNTNPLPIAKSKPVISWVGAGNYAKAVLMPCFAKHAVTFKSVASSGGVSGMDLGKKFAFRYATTHVTELIADAEVDAIVIATQHNTHAKYAIEALSHHKHVFLEKPLCITSEQQHALEQVTQRLQQEQQLPILMVGFNRRYAAHTQKIRALLKTCHEPKVFIMTVNAGALDAEHWTQNVSIGGGRIIGEACHFIDLLLYLANSPVTQVHSQFLRSKCNDTVTITLAFADGSMGTIHYLANGHRALAKERLEIYVGGKVLQLDNFRKLQGFGWPGFKKMNLYKQDKGQAACVALFLQAIQQEKESPIALADLLQVSAICLQVQAELSKFSPYSDNHATPCL